MFQSFALFPWLTVLGNVSLGLRAMGVDDREVRRRSLNPRIGIMIGGSAVARDPELVARVGADGTAANGPAAVILAKKLLAAALL